MLTTVKVTCFNLFISLYTILPLFKYRPHYLHDEKDKAKLSHLYTSSDFHPPIHVFIRLTTYHVLGTMLGTRIHQDMTMMIRNKHRPCLHRPYNLARRIDNQTITQILLFDQKKKRRKRKNYCVALLLFISKKLRTPGSEFTVLLYHN